MFDNHWQSSRLGGRSKGARCCGQVWWAISGWQWMLRHEGAAGPQPVARRTSGSGDLFSPPCSPLMTRIGTRYHPPTHSPIQALEDDRATIPSAQTTTFQQTQAPTFRVESIITRRRSARLVEATKAPAPNHPATSILGRLIRGAPVCECPAGAGSTE